MSSGAWPVVSLRDASKSVQYGFTASASADADGPKFLRITDIVPDCLDWASVPRCPIDLRSIDRFRLSDGDIVVARTGATVGYAKLIKEPPEAVFASYLVRFRPRSDVCSGFVGAIVQSSVYKEWVRSQAGGSAQPNANAQVLGAFEFGLPPLDTQRRIAGILGAYDDLIEVNRRRVAVLEEMARGLFEEWFVRFRFPGHETVPVIDTPYGPLPEGWARVPFGEVSENFDRLRKPLSGRERLMMQGSYPYYGAAKVFDHIDRFIFEGLYLLVAEDGSVITPDGYPVLQLVDGQFWVNNHAHVVRGRNNSTTPFLYLALSRVPVLGYITGAAQPKITQGALNRIPIVLASEPVMNQFNRIVGDVFNLVLSLTRANERLAASRELNEDELAIFDLLTRPAPKLTKAEETQVKAVARRLLERLEFLLRAIDWTRSQQTRGAVFTEIRQRLNELPEEPYPRGLWSEKVDDVWQFVLRRYGDGGHHGAT